MKPEDIFTKLSTRRDECRLILERAKQKSEERLNLLRKTAADMMGDKQILIGVNGSVARREVTSGSDIDLFFLLPDGEISEKEASELRGTFADLLNEHDIKMPAKGGVFDNMLRSKKLVEDIGGEEDTNTNITRRMLYLLESEHVYNVREYEDLRRRLIERYVPDNLEEHKHCLFFLNDIVRYWRTICIDFEHKTSDGTKPRAIRLIKLRF